MNLIIDIGNTCAKLAIFSNGELIGSPVRTNNTTLEDLPEVLRQHPDIKRCIISTVFALTERAKTALSSITANKLILNDRTPLPIPSIYCFPQGMGADRIAADVAAITICPEHPIMVFDAGTCLTCEMLHPQQGLVGGYISPGLHLRLLSMHEHTSALPLYDNACGSYPLMANDTENAMKGGALNGMRFEIEGYIRHFAEIYPDLHVFLTGGNHFSLDSATNVTIIEDKFLLLRGLNKILEYNEP